jgi:hypothetical protein
MKEYNKDGYTWKFMSESFAVGGKDNYTLSQPAAKLEEAITKRQGDLLRVKLPVGFVEKKNDNNRLYRKAAVIASFSEAFAEMNEGAVHGQLKGHPDTIEVPPENISHYITKGWVEDDGTIWNEWIVVPTSQGRDLASLFLSGVKIGVSTRGYGVSESENGLDIISKYKYYGTDVVSKPSTGMYSGMANKKVEIDLVKESTLSESISKTLISQNIKEEKIIMKEETTTNDKLLAGILEEMKSLSSKMIVRESDIPTPAPVNTEMSQVLISLKDELGIIKSKVESFQTETAKVNTTTEKETLVKEKEVLVSKYEALLKEAEAHKKRMLESSTEVKTLEKAADIKINELVTVNERAEIAIREVVTYGHVAEEVIADLRKYGNVAEKELDGAVDYIKFLTERNKELVSYAQTAEAIIETFRKYSLTAEKALEKITRRSDLTERAVVEVKAYAEHLEKLVTKFAKYTNKVESVLVETFNNGGIAASKTEEKISPRRIVDAVESVLKSYPMLAMYRPELLESSTVDAVKNKVNRYLGMLSYNEDKKLAGVKLTESKDGKGTGMRVGAGNWR